MLGTAAGVGPAGSEALTGVAGVAGRALATGFASGGVGSGLATGIAGAVGRVTGVAGKTAGVFNGKARATLGAAGLAGLAVGVVAGTVFPTRGMFFWKCFFNRSDGFVRNNLQDEIGIWFCSLL